MTYGPRPEPVTVKIDGIANDGGGSDGLADNVRLDVENVIGGEGADFLVGSAGANALQGGDGEDTLDGRDGNDRLDGGAQADDLIGGNGTSDVVTYAQRQGGVTVDFDDVADDGNSIDDTSGRRDNARPDVEGAVGGAGDDTLLGNAKPNMLDGQGGQDTITGDIQVDLVLGGAGNDELDGGVGNDTVEGGDGDDEVVGGTLHDTLFGGEGVDFLMGGGGDDEMFGGAGDDRLAGGIHADTMNGGTGLDTADYSDHGSVFVDLQQEIDQGNASDCRDRHVGPCFPGFDDVIADDVENVLGGPGNDNLTGDSLANVLTGGPGQDTLTSLGGDDVLRADDGENDGGLDCGEGAADIAHVDPVDGPTEDCETVN
jgi:Ca2+-binding RTX toxin-like protein